MKHIVRCPCSWHYKEPSSKVYNSVGVPGFYLSPLHDPRFQDSWVLPTEGVEPVPVHEVIAKADSSKLYRGERLEEAKLAKRNYDASLPTDSLDLAELREGWESRLPEGKFEILDRPGETVITAGSNTENSALLFANLQSNYRCSIHLDELITSAKILEYGRFKYTGGAYTIIYWACVLQEGERIAYQNRELLRHGPACNLTWNGKELEEEVFSAEDWKQHRKSLLPPRKSIFKFWRSTA